MITSNSISLDFQYWVNKITKTIEINKFQIPIPPTIDPIHIQSHSSFIEMLFNENYTGNTFRYLYRELTDKRTWPIPIKERLGIYPISSKVFICDMDPPDCSQNTYNLYSYDILMLEVLLKYRQDSESIILNDSTSIIITEDNALPTSDFEIVKSTEWSNEYENSTGSLFVGGDENIIPENAFIEYIIAEITGDNIQNIKVGDGNTNDRWVEETEDINSPGVYFLALNNRVAEDNHRKVVVTPSGETNMSIKWIIKGFIKDGIGTATSDFEIVKSTEWLNEYENSTSSLFVGGDINILPEGAFIEHIVIKVTGDNIQNIKVGDGNTNDRWVEETEDINSPGIYSLALNNRVAEDNHRKVVVTPSGETNMTIEWVIKGVGNGGNRSDFEIIKTSTWSDELGNSSSSLFVGDQNVIPENAFIEYIIAEITGDNIQNIKVGDGNTADRWVEETSYVDAPGIYSLALNNRVAEDNHRNITATPSSEANMLIKWIIKGFGVGGSVKTTTTININYEEMSPLAKLVFLYLDLKINNSYSNYDLNETISTNGTILEQIYEAYVIDLIFSHISSMGA